MHQQDNGKAETFDVAVIGAGVVGCAIARTYALAGARVVMLEKAADILDGASKGNSAILHTGFDAPPGSVEAACVTAGYREYLEIREKLGLPVMRTGALVIAWTEEQEAILPDLIAQAHANGVTDVEMLSREDTLRREPGLAPSLRASFRVPGEFIIDPWSAPLAYLGQAMAHGAELRRSCKVLGGDFGGTHWDLKLSDGSVRAGLVINAAGLYGDDVDLALIGRRDFTVRPRKGQFVVFDKSAAALAGHILLPVPTKITKGIVVCPTAYGNLLVGPTAEDQTEKDVADLVPDTLAALRARGEEILPGLKDHDVTAIYAGLRPATEEKDYRIRHHADQNYVTVGGIRSTGLTSALGTASYVFGLTEQTGFHYDPPESVHWPTVRNISEAQQRDWERPGNGGVVCQCELVTRREIESALEGPLAARSLAGLKRRTRVTMGRCQGFHCTARLAEMTEGHFAVPMAEATGHD
ncbi:NAD(P)/FAD-dependent oxidoreductase [Tropicimonas isoalkanivorans]|uniref:Glycerol-3-phosphate dehydrogenase n=1 Tax=Tropicimonas isoalkanivorans TaxID=441112 RepID=A0A1I1DL06_9RHOB|nr:NAD(P)/FAD-dependent oxidoreductase [Tropicimonas isoalkanivorans]SFB73193.1 glycerol-3-phosphate dehydrogenase [Tropicimonas isoalkanivorans]